MPATYAGGPDFKKSTINAGLSMRVMKRAGLLPLFGKDLVLIFAACPCAWNRIGRIHGHPKTIDNPRRLAGLSERRIMKLRTGVEILLGLMLALGSQAATASSLKAGKPNIVMLFIDDWAWNGSPIRMDDEMPNSQMPVVQMPNLEKLAREGMKFRNAYSGAPQCSPSRVCLQTGKSAPRSGYTVFLGKTRDSHYDTRRQYQKLPLVPNVSDLTIDKDAVTIPEALKPLGYACAHVGKWHMGGDPGEEGYALHDGNTNNDPGNTVGKVARQP
ncbi:MAG: hypothetical protein ACI9VS_003094, partial [Candidatus Binatia bacterium]